MIVDLSIALARLRAAEESRIHRLTIESPVPPPGSWAWTKETDRSKGWYQMGYTLPPKGNLHVIWSEYVRSGSWTHYHDPQHEKPTEEPPDCGADSA